MLISEISEFREAFFKGIVLSCGQNYGYFIVKNFLLKQQYYCARLSKMGMSNTVFNATTEREIIVQLSLAIVL